MAKNVSGAVEIPAAGVAGVAAPLRPAPKQLTAEEMERRAEAGQAEQRAGTLVKLRAELDQVEAELKTLGDPAAAPRKAAAEWHALVQQKADFLKDIEPKIVAAKARRQDLENAAQVPLLRKEQLGLRAEELRGLLGE